MESVEGTTVPGEMNAAVIERWALENKDRALALGKRLIASKTGDDLKGLPSLGDFEDRATAWAIANPMKAKLLVLQLYTKLQAVNGPQGR
jgi:hypothetical protein